MLEGTTMTGKAWVFCVGQCPVFVGAKEWIDIDVDLIATEKRSVFVDGAGVIDEEGTGCGWAEGMFVGQFIGRRQCFSGLIDVVCDGIGFGLAEDNLLIAAV